MAQMPETEKKILEEVEFLRDRYFTYDEPIPFCGLNLYPVNVRNYNEFMASNSTLLLNKNDDPVGIKYTHLDYLLLKLNDEKEGWLWARRFYKILELCLHVLPGVTCHKCGKHIEDFFSEERVKQYQEGTDEFRKNFFNCECGGEFIPSLQQKKDKKTGRAILVIDGHEIDSNNFNKLRKFILYQNLPDFKDDSWVDKAIRDDQAAKNEIISRDSGSATVERKILCICAATSYKIKDVYEMSIRQFISLLGVVNDLVEYKITKAGLMSGMVSLKKGQTIDNWIYKRDKGMYGASVDADALTQKINSL